MILSALKLSSLCQDRAVLQRYYHPQLFQCQLKTLFPDDKYQEYLWVCWGNWLWSVWMKRLLKARKQLLHTKLDHVCDIWSYLSLWWQLIYSNHIYLHNFVKCNFSFVLGISCVDYYCKGLIITLVDSLHFRCPSPFFIPLHMQNYHIYNLCICEGWVWKR